MLTKIAMGNVFVGRVTMKTVDNARNVPSNVSLVTMGQVVRSVWRIRIPEAVQLLNVLV